MSTSVKQWLRCLATKPWACIQIPAWASAWRPLPSAANTQTNIRKKRKSFAAFMNKENPTTGLTGRTYGMSWGWTFTWRDIGSFYRDTTASVCMSRELRESLGVGVGVRWLGVMSPWLFNVYMDDCMREVKARAGEVSPWLEVRDAELSSVFVGNTFLERKLQKNVDDFDRVCNRAGNH